MKPPTEVLARLQVCDAAHLEAALQTTHDRVIYSAGGRARSQVRWLLFGESLPIAIAASMLRMDVSDGRAAGSLEDGYEFLADNWGDATSEFIADLRRPAAGLRTPVLVVAMINVFEDDDVVQGVPLDEITETQVSP